MSEQKGKFMEELDLWTEANIIGPLLQIAEQPGDQQPEDWEQAVAEVKKAIRAKVLDSYHNGQKAGPKPARAPRTEWRR